MERFATPAMLLGLAGLVAGFLVRNYRPSWSTAWPILLILGGLILLFGLYASFATNVRRALAGEDAFTFEVRIEGADDWIWTRGRGVVHRDDAGEALVVTGTHQDITEAKQAEIALEDQVRQNTLMQAVASSANEAHTLREVLTQARSLVLLHDDWERCRGFIPNAARDGVVPLYAADDDEAEDQATPEHTAMEHALAEHVYRTGEIAWDDAKLTVAFPVRYADQIHGVGVITSGDTLHRYGMIETMVTQIAVQLGRVAEREQSQLALAAARTAHDNKGRDIVVLDLRELTPMSDYFIIATGTSRRQLHAISEEIDDVLEKQLGDKRMGIEGYEESRWILLDYGNIVVHLFDDETRGYYDLERLWTGAIFAQPAEGSFTTTTE